MIVYLDEDFIEEKKAAVPLTDRGLLLGDGLFETLIVDQGIIEFFRLHYDRLSSSAHLLKIPFEKNFSDLKNIITKLVMVNELSFKKTVVRITLTRGCGPRGLSFPVSTRSRLFVQIFPLQPLVPKNKSLMISRYCLHQTPPLCFIKHLGYQVSILAKQEAYEQGVDEAVLLNAHNHVVCATAANIFIINEKEEIITPSLPSGCLPGIIRGLLLEWAKKNKLIIKEQLILPSQLETAKSIFLTNSVIGIQPFQRFINVNLNPFHPLVLKVKEGYEKLKEKEKNREKAEK